MDRRPASRTTLVLAELMMAILMFALCAAVCLQLFVHADRISDEGDDLNHAVSLAKTAASCYKACDGDLSKWCDWMEGAVDTSQSDGMRIYYDAHWNVTDVPCDNGYTLELLPGPKSLLAETVWLCEANIAVRDGQGAEIFALTVKQTITQTGGERHAP